MSIESMSIVLHHSRALGTDKVVLLGIANHEGDGGAWPSLATLARYANVNRRAVQSSIRKLEQMRELWIGDQEGGTQSADPRYRTNLYRVLLCCPADCDGSTQHRVGVKPTTPLVDPGVSSSASRGVVQRDPGVSSTTPEPSLEPSVEPPARSSPDGDGVCFDDFWKIYPRKIAKAVARESWDRQTKGNKTVKPTDPEVILAGVRARVAWWARARTPMDKIPHPATWLNQQRWIDELEPTPASRAVSAAKRAADVDAQVRDEFEDAVAAGDAELAWGIFLGKAAAKYGPWFRKVDGELQRGASRAGTLIIRRSDGEYVTDADIDGVAAARAGIEARCRAARGEPPLSQPMLEPTTPTTALEGPT